MKRSAGTVKYDAVFSDSALSMNVLELVILNKDDRSGQSSNVLRCLSVTAGVILVILAGVSCKNKKKPQDSQSIFGQEKNASGQNRIVSRQQLELEFKLADENRVEFKFCMQKEICPVWTRESSGKVLLVSTVPPYYSLRICKLANASCGQWQLVLLQPVQSLKLSPGRQTTNSVVFSDNPASGWGIAVLGNGESVFSRYLNLDGLKASPGAYMGLTATGIPNLGNTCFLNSTLQILFTDREYRKQINQTLSTKSVDGGGITLEKENFLKQLNHIFELLDKNTKPENGDILELMTKYDRYVEADNIAGAEKFGNEFRQRAADEFYSKFKEAAGSPLTFEEHGFSSRDSSVLDHVTQQKYSYETLNRVNSANSFQDLVDFAYYDTLEIEGKSDSIGEFKSYRSKRLVADPDAGIQQISFRAQRQTVLREGVEVTVYKDERLLPDMKDGKITLPFVSNKATPVKKGLSDTRPMFQQTMELKSFIVHMGGANGGHYVTYRKEKEVWKIISDDSEVRTIDATEAIQTARNSGTVLQFDRISEPKAMVIRQKKIVPDQYKPMIAVHQYVEKSILESPQKVFSPDLDFYPTPKTIVSPDSDFYPTPKTIVSPDLDFYPTPKNITTPISSPESTVPSPVSDSESDLVQKRHVSPSDPNSVRKSPVSTSAPNTVLDGSPNKGEFVTKSTPERMESPQVRNQSATSNGKWGTGSKAALVIFAGSFIGLGVYIHQNNSGGR